MMSCDGVWERTVFLVDPVIKREQDDTKKRRARKAQDSHREKQRVNSWQMRRQEMFFIELVESACGPSYPIIPASSQQSLLQPAGAKEGPP